MPVWLPFGIVSAAHRLRNIGRFGERQVTHPLEQEVPLNSHLARALALLAVTSTATLGGCTAPEGDDDSSTEQALSSQAQGIFKAASDAGLDFTWRIDAKYRRVVLTGGFVGVDGHPRRFRLYQKLGRCAGLVVFLNGRAEFIEKYDVLFSSRHEYPAGSASKSETLADLPFSFLTVDHAGQGESTTGVTNGHVDSFDTYVSDVERVLAPFRMADPGGKLVLFGHSMGGLIATLYAERHPSEVSALVLSSPMFGIGAPPDIPIEQVKQLAYAYALPQPYGLGLADRCSTSLPPTVLGGIAQCLTNDGCRACFQAPVADPNTVPGCDAVGFTSEQWAALRQGYAYLESPASIGCQIETDMEKLKAGCVFPSPTFNGLTTDRAYCEYFATHENRGATQTFGWVKAGFDAITKARSAEEIGKLRQPVLMLTTAIDPVVPAADQTTTCGTIASCSQTVYVPSTDGVFFHELLAETGRAKPIAKIRAFLEAQAK